MKHKNINLASFLYMKCPVRGTLGTNPGAWGHHKPSQVSPHLQLRAHQPQTLRNPLCWGRLGCHPLNSRPNGCPQLHRRPPLRKNIPRSSHLSLNPTPMVPTLQGPFNDVFASPKHLEHSKQIDQRATTRFLARTELHAHHLTHNHKFSPPTYH